MLKSDFCNDRDVYIVVKAKINTTGTDNANRRNKKLIFKNNAPFTLCITKINYTVINNAEDLDIVILMYNLLEYSDNYSVTSETFWNYYRDEMNDDVNENNFAGNYRINNNKTTTVNILSIRQNQETHQLAIVD